MKMYGDPDVKLLPLCYTPEGCPIEELAADPEVNRACSRFLSAKALFRITGDSKVQEGIFSELSLYEDTANHLDMEKTYLAWLKIKQESGESESEKWNKIL